MDRVVALDVATVPVVDPKIERHRVDVRVDDAGPLLAGADALVHLAFADGDGDRRGAAGRRRRRRHGAPARRRLGGRCPPRRGAVVGARLRRLAQQPAARSPRTRRCARTPSCPTPSSGPAPSCCWRRGRPTTRAGSVAVLRPCTGAGARRLELDGAVAGRRHRPARRWRRSRRASSCTSTISPPPWSVVRRAQPRRPVQRRARRLDPRRRRARPRRRGAPSGHAAARSAACSPASAGASSAAPSRPGSCRTRPTRGSWPTTGSRRPAGSPATPTSRRTWPAPRPGGGRCSARSASRSWRWAAPGWASPCSAWGSGCWCDGWCAGPAVRPDVDGAVSCGAAAERVRCVERGGGDDV